MTTGLLAPLRRSDCDHRRTHQKAEENSTNDRAVDEPVEWGRRMQNQGRERTNEKRVHGNFTSLHQVFSPVFPHACQCPKCLRSHRLSISDSFSHSSGCSTKISNST